MRQIPRSPAAQLKSVAVRYQLPKISPAFCRSSTNSVLLATTTAKPVRVRRVNRRWVRDEKLQRLEAVLFLAREPLPTRKLSQYANLADGTEARTLIRRLNEIYDESGRAFRVEEVAGGYQMLTRAKFSTWLRRLSHVPAETRLSAPAMETLAVVAYRQPVLRADLEAIRGVNCGEILRQLMERDLVRISGRSEELGRPFLYSTTKNFLQLFGLACLEDLPGAEALRMAPLPRAPQPAQLQLPEQQNSNSEPENDEWKLAIND